VAGATNSPARWKRRRAETSDRAQRGQGEADGERPVAGLSEVWGGVPTTGCPGELAAARLGGAASAGWVAGCWAGDAVMGTDEARGGPPR